MSATACFWKGEHTSKSTQHGCATIDQIELSLLVSVGDTSQTKESGQEVYSVSKDFETIPGRTYK